MAGMVVGWRLEVSDKTRNASAAYSVSLRNLMVGRQGGRQEPSHNAAILWGELRWRGLGGDD